MDELQRLIGSNEFRSYGYASSEILGIVITANCPKALSFLNNKR
jgi:hypothetical protein